MRLPAEPDSPDEPAGTTVPVMRFGRDSYISWRAAFTWAITACLLVPSAAFARFPEPHASLKVKARNVILFIGDGMGYNHVEAASLYSGSDSSTPVFVSFPTHRAVATFAHPSTGGGYSPDSAWSSLGYVRQNPTDSGAAATAMATGVKTLHGRIGIDVDGVPRGNVIEAAERLGKRTGVVTSVTFSDATPAGFAVHAEGRSDRSAIANKMLRESALDVIMGAGHPYFDDSGTPSAPTASRFVHVGGAATWQALAAGGLGGDADGNGTPDRFTLVQTREQFEALASGPTPYRVCGVPRVHTTLQQGRSGDAHAPAYEEAHNPNVPTLATMTRAALNVLDDGDDGLFLVVEGGAIDRASHEGQAGRMLEEMREFDDAVDAGVAWVEENSDWKDTLVIVTADHETGQLAGPGSCESSGTPIWQPLEDRGPLRMPGMEFLSASHTNSLVPLYACGSAARFLDASATSLDPVRGRYLDNTDIAKVLFATMK